MARSKPPVPQRLKGVPAYRPHLSGQARVTLNGKDEYLGDYGSPQSVERYWQFIREWEARGRQPVVPPGSALTVVELLDRYLTYLEPRASDSMMEGAKQVIRLLRDQCGFSSVEDIRPATMRAIQKSLIERGNCLNTIKDRMTRIRAILRWGVAEELVPPDVLARCKAVSPPTEHEGVRITEEREPVEDTLVSKTLPHLPPIVADMVTLQRYTGMRPGEVCSMSWAQIDKSFAARDGTWHYRPIRHKTRRLGKPRVVALGAESQALLLKYSHRDPELPIFSPRESEHHRLAEVHQTRRTPMTPSQIKRAVRAAARRESRRRRPTDGYTPCSYRRVIARAVKQAELPHWHPHLLRHARGTELAGSGGLHLAQAALGHADPRMAQHYAHLHRQTALLAQAARTESACGLKLRA
ncbi:MAG: tyrosine-type recombinase/integrase [Phycisphaerales bacterium]|nr:tyrosine-type recombinase/integrase [Phycisphaerales bacterium]